MGSGSEDSLGQIRLGKYWLNPITVGLLRAVYDLLLIVVYHEGNKIDIFYTFFFFFTIIPFNQGELCRMSILGNTSD